MTDRDKQLERERYDARARAQILHGQVPELSKSATGSSPAYLRTPYQFFERRIAELLGPEHLVLELGAGTGAHTMALLATGAQVLASDLSEHSLTLLQQRLSSVDGRLQVRIADMENTPFDEATFDAVVMAGSLSYGDPVRVDREVRRLLRPGGMFICVDSLNHNPVYRLNRWLQYVRGQRSASTLRRMPDLARISAMGRGFAQIDVKFFGALTYLMPLVARISGENDAQLWSDRLDDLIGVRRSAFKFVLVAQNFAGPLAYKD